MATNMAEGIGWRKRRAMKVRSISRRNVTRSSASAMRIKGPVVDVGELTWHHCGFWFDLDSGHGKWGVLLSYSSLLLSSLAYSCLLFSPLVFSSLICPCHSALGLVRSCASTLSSALSSTLSSILFFRQRKVLYCKYRR